MGIRILFGFEAKKEIIHNAKGRIFKIFTLLLMFSLKKKFQIIHVFFIVHASINLNQDF